MFSNVLKTTVLMVGVLLIPMLAKADRHQLDVDRHQLTYACDQYNQSNTGRVNSRLEKYILRLSHSLEWAVLNDEAKECIISAAIQQKLRKGR